MQKITTTRPTQPHMWPTCGGHKTPHAHTTYVVGVGGVGCGVGKVGRMGEANLRISASEDRQTTQPRNPQFFASNGGAPMTAGINTKPPIGALRLGPRPREAEEVPIGATVVTPLGHHAEVIGYRGYGSRGGKGRGHRVWLVCRYLARVNARSRRYDVVQLLPELVTVLKGKT